MTMLLMNKGENPIHRMWIEHHYLSLAGDVFREFDPVKKFMKMQDLVILNRLPLIK